MDMLAELRDDNKQLRCTLAERLDLINSIPGVGMRTAVYRRLIARGKSHKQALIACARKLIIYANTVVARGLPWPPSHAPCST
jgi:hypothetical protein